MSRKSKKHAPRTPRRQSAMDSLADHYRQVLGTTATFNEPAPDKIQTLIVPQTQEERVRAVLGLPADGPRPEVSEENLRRYHSHLAKQLKLPFQAKSVVPGFVENPKERFVVVSLLDFDPENLVEGIQCTVMLRNELYELPLADVRPSRHPSNQTLIEDYASWLEPTDESETTRERPPLEWKSLLGVAVLAAVVGAGYAAVVGATTASLDGAVAAVCTGTLLLGVVAFVFAAWTTAPYGRWWPAAFFTAILGAVIGGLFGALCIAFVGSLAGALLGGAMGFALGRKAGLLAGLGLAVGAALGTVIQAMNADADAAWTGIWQGGIVGAVGGPLVLVAMTVFAALGSTIGAKLPPSE